MIILRTLWNGVKCISEISLKWDNKNIVIIDGSYTLFLQFHVNYNNVDVNWSIINDKIRIVENQKKYVFYVCLNN